MAGTVSAVSVGTVTTGAVVVGTFSGLRSKKKSTKTSARMMATAMMISVFRVIFIFQTRVSVQIVSWPVLVPAAAADWW